MEPDPQRPNMPNMPNMPPATSATSFAGPNPGSQMGVNYGSVNNYFQAPVQEPKELVYRSRPRAHYVIPSMESRYFTGRDSALDELKQRLFLQASTERLALFGLGGIGKTQLALQLARWVKVHEPDRSIFWASALSVESFEQACLQIAKKLQPHQDAENESAMELVHRELSDDNAGKWLFIVDNADDAELTFNELDQFFPVSEAGVTLLTTRSKEVAISFAGRDILELQNMKAAEGIDFLTKILGNDVLDNPDSTSQLLEELNFLPLAIAQAAYYISRNDGTIGRYLELMHKSEKERMRLVSREFHDITRYRKMPNAVAKTWLISFKQIQNSDPPAADLLGFISCFEPKAIPKSILPSVGSEEETEFAIGTLCAYGFVTKRSNEEMFDIHSLIHLSTRLWVAEEGITQQVIETVTQHMNHCFPSDDFPNRETWRAYLPHTKLILNGVELGCAENRYSLLSKIGMCLRADGRSRDALTALKNACTWYESQHEQEHPSRLRSQHDLASAYLDNRQIKQGLELLVHVVALRERLLDEDNHDLLASQHELARAYVGNGKIKDAIELIERVVMIQGEILDEEDPRRLASQHELARAYLNNGQIKEAIELFEHVVVVEGRMPDEEDPDRLISQQFLASAYLDNGQIKQALELLVHVVASRERLLDEEDPSRLDSQHFLARAYSKNGQTKEAIELFERVVTIKGKTLDEEDPSRLASQYALARAYLKNGQTKEAIELFERVVATEGRILDEEDPSRLVSQHALARAYSNNRQTKEAMKLFERVVTIKGKLLDEEDPSRLASQYALARAYSNNGQTKEAIEIFEHVAAKQEILDEEDPSRLASQYALALAYSNNGQTKEAIELLGHVVAKQELLDEKDPIRLASQHELALAYSKNGQTKEAIELFEHVVAKQELLDEKDSIRLASQHELARAYLDNGQTKEAIELFEHVVAKQELLGEEDPNRLASQHVLARAYTANGQTRQALELIKHVVSVEERTLDAEHPDRLESQKVLEEIEEGMRKAESLKNVPVI